MAAQFKKREESVTLTFEVFDLEFDEDGRRQLADDPRGFLLRLLEEEGATVNGLFLESNETFQISPGEEVNVRSVWHCTSPASMRSRRIVVTEMP